jgi:ATP-dependent protease Clp ATPase subunit
MRNRNAHCSFCRKNYRDVGPLVEDPDNVYICGPCVELCQTIIDQEKRRLGQSIRAPARFRADEIEVQLGQYVSGQQQARNCLRLETGRILFFCGSTGEGLAPELARRFPVVIRLDALDEETLVRMASDADLGRLAEKN